jgi:hypothetical protein
MKIDKAFITTAAAGGKRRVSRPGRVTPRKGGQIKIHNEALHKFYSPRDEMREKIL